MIMRTISGHCVKKILPSLLAGLEEPQWRSKKGSIEMLGAMAYLAPKQLSISLPTIVPKLTSVLTDSHTQVRAAANSSLLRFGEVYFHQMCLIYRLSAIQKFRTWFRSC